MSKQIRQVSEIKHSELETIRDKLKVYAEEKAELSKKMGRPLTEKRLMTEEEEEKKSIKLASMDYIETDVMEDLLNIFLIEKTEQDDTND